VRRRRTPADDTRDRILASARRLFAYRPDAPAGDVAHEAGVSRATLHRHFGSKSALLRAAEVEPELGARERALAAGIELLARDGLAKLSMDELAKRSGVSRANLYRLFPGKSALFRELVRVYSPLEPIGTTVTKLVDQPPEVVMPAIARAAARHLEGRIGLVRSLLFEVSAPSTEAAGARELAMEQALGPLAAYLVNQMQAGQLRPMHPLLAMQSFAGPIVFHLILRPFAESLLGFDMPVEEVAGQLAQTWVAGMRPDKEVKEG
jgi:AcrR family transcriptional regulator